MMIQLKPDLEKFIDDQVKSGRYDSAEQAVNAAVARFREEEILLSEDPDDEDIAAIERGISELNAGHGRPWDEVRAELKQQYLSK